MKAVWLSLLLSVGLVSSFAAEQGGRPNILWICIEDWSPDLSCYGTKGLHTPNVDKLASEGIRYEWAFTTSPVCSTSRSAMMTGFHQNFIRANQHREHHKQPLPTSVMDDWVEANKGNYDFNKYGRPAWYPTRTLAEWKKARATWNPWVFRGVDSKMSRPNVVHSKKRRKKK